MMRCDDGIRHVCIIMYMSSLSWSLLGSVTCASVMYSTWSVYAMRVMHDTMMSAADIT